jgi:hypothetical protein
VEVGQRRKRRHKTDHRSKKPIPAPVEETYTETNNRPVYETYTTAPVRKLIPLSKSRAGGRAVAATGRIVSDTSESTSQHQTSVTTTRRVTPHAYERNGSRR